MKLKNFMIGLLVCLLVGVAPAKAASNITEALDAVKATLKGKDVDYYLITSSGLKSSTVWKIFVDCEPLKGWEHECYLYEVPKSSSSSSSAGAISKTVLRIPPNDNLSPLDVKVRSTVNSFCPNLNISTNGTNEEVAERTYVVILSGGGNKNYNYRRYWNDCSFVFQALKKKYGVPQENFRVIISDGTNPAVDMCTGPGTYISSPLDLDGDGVNDIGYSATKQNISTVLSQLANILNRDDHLLFYVIDHGGTDDYISRSYINLWGTEKLYDYELAQYLKPMLDNNVSVNVVLGQCYSGGFVDDLSAIGCVVSAACSGSESSWARTDLNYDEFVYHWTCAINGAHPNSSIANADYNNDGKISMSEAYTYAQSHDQRTETPQYYGGPDAYGQYLAFTHLPKSDDLYIKDNYLDVGDEPNYTADIFWNSPSIWVRNNEDWGQQHENPYYNNNHKFAYVYSTIHNKGEKRYYRGKWLHLNWAWASVGIHAKTWRGRESMDDMQTGGSMECTSIMHEVSEETPLQPVLPKDSITVQTDWMLPKKLKTDTLGKHHYCLYARILDGPTDEVFIDGTTKMYPSLSNKEAQKNLTIIRIADDPSPVCVYVRNLTSAMTPYSLEIYTRSDNDSLLFSIADVELEMTQTIYDAWNRGGRLGVDISQVSQNQNGTSTQSRTVRLLSSNSKLQSVKMNPDEFDLVSMSFNIQTFPTTETSYYIDLIQRDENGVVVGGETFLVIVPPATQLNMPVKKETTEDGNTKMTVESDDFKTITWFNEEGDKLGTSNNLIVHANSQRHEITVTGITVDGENATSTIVVDPMNGFSNVFSQENTIQIKLLKNAPDATSVRLCPVEDSCTSTMVSIPKGAKEMSVNTSRIPAGVYVISLIVDSEIVDSRKVIVNK